LQQLRVFPRLPLKFALSLAQQNACVSGDLPATNNFQSKDSLVNKTLIALISAAFMSIGVAHATTPAPTAAAKPATAATAATPAAAPAAATAAKCDPKTDKNGCKDVKAAAAPAAAATPAAPAKPAEPAKKQ
jgi:hypothetical protein